MTCARLFPLVGIVGFALLAPAANAQDYGTYDRPVSYGSAPEEVIVRPPYYGKHDSAIGAPIVTVSLSRAVRFDDLDLTSAWGVRVLHDRISVQARLLCQQLNKLYPATEDDTEGGWPLDANCYDRAVSDASYQVDAAIRQARGYGD